MAQYKKIKTNTSSTTFESNAFEINVFNDNKNLNQGVVGLDFIEISDVSKTKDGLDILEGVLITKIDKKEINFSIDINGNLLILHNNANSFHIDENGSLIYSN